VESQSQLVGMFSKRKSERIGWTRGRGILSGGFVTREFETGEKLKMEIAAAISAGRAKGEKRGVGIYESIDSNVEPRRGAIE